MAMTLVLTREGRTVDRYEFEDQAIVIVGRGEDCDVRVDNLSVSRRHCEILLKDGFHLVADQGSSNGTFVNGKKIREASLNPGDVITVGEFTLNYTATFAKVGQPVIPLISQGMPNMTIQINPAPQAAPPQDGVHQGPRVTSKLRGHLTVEATKRNVLLQKTTFVIGGAVTNDVQVESRFAPRIAAIVLRERFCFRILDVSPKGKSVNLNGNPTRNAELENGDVIDVAGLVFRFYKGLPAVEESPAFTQTHAQTRKMPRIQKPR